MPEIRSYRIEDEHAVVDLWRGCDLTRPWNNPKADIARKLTVQPEMFLVAEEEGQIVGTVMAGFDGHRGWINYLAVHADWRRRGIGRQLMRIAADMLEAAGCPKVNLQIRRSNLQAAKFYESLGYREDDVVSYGKRLIRDE